MTTTLRKRQANRINALRSTGPRSVAGKRVAAANARLHGLSVPIDANVYARQIDSIVSLLASEWLPVDQAKDLALRILDYERNLQQERESFAQNFLGVAAEPTVDEDAQRLELYDQYFSLPEFASERGLDAEERAEQRAFRVFARFVQRGLRRQAKDNALSAIRYQKRSSNQLIKALKAVD